MGRIIAAIGAILFIWWAYPHFAKGEWFAPTPLPPGWWGLALAPEGAPLAQPEEGYGLYRFDYWNQPANAMPIGRPATHEDFVIRY